MTRIAEHLIRTYYYKLSMTSGEEGSPFEFYAVKNDLKGFDPRRFKSNQPIEDWPAGVTIYALGELPSDHMLSSGLHIISDPFRRALEEFGVEGAQFLPVRVVHQESGAELGPYWALHAYRHVEGLDWEHTDWQEMHGTELEEYPREKYPFLAMMSPVLIWERVKDVHIFQLAINGEADAARVIYLSDRLKAYLEERGTNRGVFFSKVPVH